MNSLLRTLKSVIFLAAVASFVVFSWTKASAQPPVVLAIEPNVGHAGETDLFLVITGQNFKNGASVFFENIGITVVGGVTFIDPTRLEFTVDIDPTAPLGPGDVFVINPDYLQGALVDGFEVLPPETPNPTRVVPGSGYTGDAGLHVTIEGDLMYTTKSVDFGGGITVNSIDGVYSHSVDCTISIDWLAIPGFRDVTVYSDYGNGVLPNGFEVLAYPEPSITGIEPTEGCRGDTNLVVIVTGADFIDGIDFDFQPSDGITVKSVLYNSPTQATLTLDIGSGTWPGLYGITATNPDGQTGSLPDAFNVLDCSPKIEYVDPPQGNQGDIALPVTIFGADFGDVTNVTFGAGIAVSVPVASSDRIDVELDISPTATPGFRDVTVFNPYGYDTMFSGFEVIEVISPAPVIESVVPDYGMQGAASLPVTIYGQNLESVDTVDFGLEITLSILGTSESQIDLLLDIAPTAPDGPHDVYVSGPDGEDTLPGGFEVILAPPQIQSVNPNQGERGAMSLPVSIYGAFLSQVDSVSFGSGIDVSVPVASSDRIDVELDIYESAALGFRDVTVTSPGGDDVLPGGFEVILGPPSLENVVPGQGAQGETLDVVIAGANLDLVNDVDFGAGITVDTFSVMASNRVDATITIDQLAAIGFRDVTVWDTEMRSATLPNGFEVTEAPIVPPTILGIDPDSGYQGDTALLISFTGADFQDGLTVDFGHPGIYEGTPNFMSDSLFDVYIDIDIDATPGPTDVVVTNPDGGEDIVIDGFTVLEKPIIPPVILGLDPPSGYPGDMNLQIRVTGEGFQDGIEIDFSDLLVRIVGVSYGSTSFFDVFVDIDPAITPGLLDVHVQNPDGGEDILVNGFEVFQLAPVVVDSIIPNQGYQSDTLDFQIAGSGFETGATVEFFPDSAYFYLTATVVSDSLIEGSLSIEWDTPIGFYSVRVTNPDLREGVLPDGFEVLEQVQPPMPPEPGNLIPATVCVGAIGDVQTLYGNFFQPGIEATFEYGGSPTDYIYDVYTTFIDAHTIEITLSVRDDAPEDLFSLIVTNPDGQWAYGPPLGVILCEEPAVLEWQETLLDVFIDFTGVAGEEAEATGLAHIMNTGEADFHQVVISMTDLVSSGGLRITPEMVEIWPSIVGELPGGESAEVNVIFTIPIDDEMMAAGGGVFMGSMIATDAILGDTAALPVSVTIQIPGEELVEIDPLCLQVDLLWPGVPAETVPGVFYENPEEFPEEVAEALGGCESPFPLFGWASYAGDCPGYMETWVPSHTLTVYPVYPGQSAEEAMANQPVWRQSGIMETSIQYPLTAEELAGFYLWQVEVVPQAMPGMPVTVGPQTPVFSEIWAFCVEGRLPGRPEEIPFEGEIAWFPTLRIIEGCGMVPATLVISEGAAGGIGFGTSASVWITDDRGDTMTIDLNLAGIQFSDWNPLPDFGPAAIVFGLNLTVVGEVSDGMGPDDLVMQMYNGGVMLGQLVLDGRSNGRLTVGADISGATAEFPLTIIWPWDNPCWQAWLEWAKLKAELAEDCRGEWDALRQAERWRLQAELGGDEAFDAYQEALDRLAEARADKAEADEAYDDAMQACYDFFAEHIFSNYISFSNPGPGWSYVEAFGGAVGIWFLGDQGAELLNSFLDEYRAEYGELWDNLRAAQEAHELGEAAVDDAENGVNPEAENLDAATTSLQESEVAYNTALGVLNDCLERMRELEEAIAFIEWMYPDCFRQQPGGQTGSGVGTPGTESDPQGPPITGDGVSAGGLRPSDPGTGIGTGGDECECDDCDELWEKVKSAREAHRAALAELAQAETRLEGARDALDAANQALEDARDAADQAQSRMEELQADLDSFMVKHVFSKVVGGTPEYGPNYVRYKGVDIYFSNFDVFWQIFQLIKPWISQIADELEQAQDEHLQAQQVLAEALAAHLEAADAYNAALTEFTGAQTRVVQAAVELFIAESQYEECIELARLCHEQRGCPPYVPPHLREPGAGPGWMPGAPEQPGAPAPGEGPRPGAEREGEAPAEPPPGQGTGPEGAEPGYPCGNCDGAFDAWSDALGAVADAEAALAAVLNIAEEAGGQVENALDQVSEAAGKVDYFRDVLGTLPPGSDEYNAVLALLEAAQYELYMAEAALRSATGAFDGAVNDAETARGELETAQHVADLAEFNYNDCVRRLRECEREQGQPPSDVPADGGGYVAPIPPNPGEFLPDGDGRWVGVPGWEGEGGEIGGEGEGVPGARPGEGEGGPQVKPCPCKSCADEYNALVQAEAALDAATDAWSQAFDVLMAAWDALNAAKAAEEKAKAEVDAAQKQVNELQARMDEIRNQINAMEGLSTDPSGGRSSGTVGGVRIYFNDPAKFNAALPALKAALGNIGQQLAAAKKRLQDAQKALDDAQFARQRAETAKLLAENAEQRAWDALLAALRAYNAAYDAYLSCLIDRLMCILDHPEECANEPLEPWRGTTGQGGKPQGKDCGCKQAVESQLAEMIDGQPDLGDVLDGVGEGIEAKIGETQAELGAARETAAQAQADADAATAALDDAVAELGDFLEELNDFLIRMDEILATLPEGAFILDESIGPPEGYESESIGAFTIYYPAEAADEVEEWLDENRGEAAGIEQPLPGEEISQRVADAADQYAESMGRLQDALGDVGALEGMLDALTEISDAWSPQYEQRSAEVEEQEAVRDGITDGIMELREQID